MTLGLLLSAPCWAQEELPANSSVHRWFGWATDVDGDTIAVGAPWSWDWPKPYRAGAVSLYEQVFGEWAEAEMMNPASLEQNHLFGWSVDLEGTTLVVGAPRWDSPDSGPGKVFVFEKVGDVWPIVAEFQPSTQDWNQFGRSVSLDGDTLLIGAPREDGIGGVQSGVVFAYERVDGDWYLSQVLSDPGGKATDFFGYHLAHEGNRAVVGAYQSDGPYPGTGAVHVLERVDGSWVFDAKLTRSTPEWDDFFGRTVAIEQDRIAVGTQDDVLIFELDEQGEWQEVKTLSPGPLSFGHDLELIRGQLLVGEPGYHDPGRFHGFQGLGYDEVLTHEIQVSNMQNLGVSVAGNEKWVVAGAHKHGGTGSVWLYPFTGAFPPFVEVLCSCDDGPCGSSPGTGCPNSTGAGATLSFVGTTGIAVDDMVLTVTELPGQQMAMIFMGGAPNGVDLGDGQLCVGPGAAGLFRYPVQGTGLGTIQLGPGFANYSEQEFAEFGGALQPGDTWHFQCWYRDPFGPCGSGVNLTNSLAITFTL